MRTLIAAALLLSVACASSDDVDYVPSPSAQPAAQQSSSASDARLAEMQMTMTELLERLDVLNARIAKLESGPPAPAPTQTVATPTPAAPAQQQPRAAEVSGATQSRALANANIAESYRNAIVLYGKNRVADARRAFQDVFDSDPTGELADNALFWIGESYFAAGDFNNAVRYYRRVTTEFADQNKAPDALFKTAVAQIRTGDLALARQTLQQVIDKYPYSTPAASAKHELQRIKF